MAVEEEVVVDVAAEVQATPRPRPKHQEVVMAAAVEVVARFFIAALAAEEVAMAAVKVEDSKAAQSWRTILMWGLSMLRTGMVTNEKTNRS